MNKKLLTAVIGAALAAGPIVASAAGPTVYGKLHMSLDRQENGGDGTAAIERGYVSSNSSRFGIKGDEDLGGGMKALYNFESRIRVDNATDAAFSGSAIRTTFVGMSTMIGTVRAGLMDSPVKEVGTAVDLFRERIGDSRSIYTAYDTSTSTTSTGAATVTEGSYIRNAIRYDSPKFGGNMSVSAHYGAAEGTTPATSTGGRIFGAGFNGAVGPVSFGVAYGVADGATMGPTTSTPNTKDEKEWRATGKFDFGAGDVRLFYASQSDLGGNSGSNNSGAEADRSVTGIGGSFKIPGNNVIKAQYYKADKLKGVEGTGGSLLAVGFDHSFSKTTLVYVAYAASDNGSATAVFKPSGGGHGDSVGIAGDDKGGTAYSAGIEVLF